MMHSKYDLIQSATLSLCLGFVKQKGVKVQLFLGEFLRGHEKKLHF